MRNQKIYNHQRSKVLNNFSVIVICQEKAKYIGKMMKQQILKAVPSKEQELTLFFRGEWI